MLFRLCAASIAKSDDSPTKITFDEPSAICDCRMNALGISIPPAEISPVGTWQHLLTRPSTKPASRAAPAIPTYEGRVCRAPPAPTVSNWGIGLDGQSIRLSVTPSTSLAFVRFNSEKPLFWDVMSNPL